MTSRQKTKRIPLTQGKFAIVDAEDYDRLNQHKWYACKQRNNYYAGRYVDCNGKRANLFMHQEIMHTPKDMATNHINHNGLDNRKINLRICNIAQSQFTQRPRKNKSSIYKGVYWYRRHNKWQSGIKCNDKRYFLGYFKDEIEAARAYDQAAIRLFGEFACLNFPEVQAA